MENFSHPASQSADDKKVSLRLAASSISVHLRCSFDSSNESADRQSILYTRQLNSRTHTTDALFFIRQTSLAASLVIIRVSNWCTRESFPVASTSVTTINSQHVKCHNLQALVSSGFSSCSCLKGQQKHSERGPKCESSL